LLVKEHRVVESIAGNERLEIQWRLSTLREAKAVTTQYHKYLSERDKPNEIDAADARYHDMAMMPIDIA
jgi:hypothetical protein